MGSKRRMPARSKRTRKLPPAEQIESTPAQEFIGRKDGRTLLDLPHDIFDVIIHMLGVGDAANRGSVRDLANLARTSKALRAAIAPYLYQKIYTKIGTLQDTSSIVRLVRQRPDIRPMIRTMVLDDFDHQHTRELLSYEFPRLQRLLIQHVGDFPRFISPREKRHLNKDIVPQPKLTYCKETRQ